MLSKYLRKSGLSIPIRVDVEPPFGGKVLVAVRSVRYCFAVRVFVQARVAHLDEGLKRGYRSAVKCCRTGSVGYLLSK